MKKICKKLLALLLVLVLSVQMGELVLASAAEELRTALDPTSRIDLFTPDDLAEGNWFFIRERQFEIGEKSEDKLYVPIQRAGDLSEAASVTLKLADITSHYGVNYTAEIFRVKQEAVAELGEFSLVDVIYENQETVDEIPELSEEEAEELIARQGEVDITDAAGNHLGTLTAEADETETGGETLELVPEEVEPVAEEGVAPAAGEPNSANRLQAARDAFTGTVSDRQTLGSDISWMSPGLQKLYDNGDGSLPPEEQEEDLPNSIPGYLFKLDYAAGESVKFLVVTPLYSEKADGDSSLLLTLEEPGDGFQLNEDFFTSYVTIQDEDEPQPVVVSFSQAEYFAEDGKVTLTVTRRGAINEIVTVQVTTYDGSALQGTDYSGVGAKLYFPMGLESRTLEIPVGHSTTEKDFYVTITPVSECTAGLGTARIVIPAVEQGAELMLDDRYLDEPFTNVTSFNGGTVDGSSGTFTTVDKKGENVGLQIGNGWGDFSYFYDGVQLEWSAKISFGFEGHLELYEAGMYYNDKYKYWNSLTTSITDVDTGTFSSAITAMVSNNDFSDEVVEYYFGREVNPHTYILRGYPSITSWISDTATVTMHALTPIKREFRFEVLPADPLGLRGVPEDDERQINGVYINSSLTDASVSVFSNESFALTAQNVSEYSRFAGIDAVAPDGSTIRIANASPGTRTINVQVTESMINTLAANGCITWTDNRRINEKAKLGTIKIKPVFEKIPATVRIDEGAYGCFEGFEGGGEYQYYLGERITLKTALNERGVAAHARGSGIGYIKADGKEGVRLDQSNDSPYLNTAMTKVFLIDQPYTVLWPIFDTSGNSVTVQVSGADLEYFDTGRGFFTLDTGPNYNPETDIYTYHIADNAMVNQVMLLTAEVKDTVHVPLWKDGRSEDWYCGALFPIRVGTSAAENVITLSVHSDQYKQLRVIAAGTIGAQEINLATGRPGGRVGTASDALIYFCEGAGLSGPNGEFTILRSHVVSGYPVRYAVSYNGALTIRETRAPDFDFLAIVREAESNPDTDWEAFWEKYVDLETFEMKPIPLDMGLVEIPSFSTLGAHITNVYAIQDHHYMSDVKILEMNGQNTVLAARVSSGEGYMLDGELRHENILGVTFYFMNPLTNELHGEFEAAYDEETDTWRVDLGAFTPNKEDLFTFGDVLYAQLTTDKQLAAVYDAESGTEGVMCYDPVSTGYAVISDTEYDPILFDWNLPVDAESVFGPGGVVEQAGGDPALCVTPYDEALLQEGSRTTYGEFPFIGELNFIITVAAKIGGGSIAARAVADTLMTIGTDSEDDSELMSDEGELMGSFIEGRPVRVGIAMKFGSLPYGGTRFVFAMTFTTGNDNWIKHMANPWQDTGAAARFFSNSNQVRFTPENDKTPKQWNNKRTNANGFFGTALFSLTFAVGFYLDFGYINITTTDAAGHSTVEHDCVFLGGGGVIGYIGSIRNTVPVATPVPMYIGAEAEATIMLFLGSGKDPNKTLDRFKADRELDGMDYGFTYQLTGSLTGKGILGVGFDQALGLRGNLGMKIEMVYSPTFEKWFPHNWYFTKRPFSYGAGLTMSGYLDAVFVNIPLATFSVPITYQGYLHLFNQMRIGARVVNYVQEGVNDLLEGGKGDPEVIRRCTELCDEILRKIERFESPLTTADQLRDYAHEHGVISSFEYMASQSAEIGGLLGMVGKLLDDEEAAAPTWSVQPHTASRWVAGENAELMSAFSPVSSSTVVEDSRRQTNARLMDIGDGRLLMVFLDDDPNRSETHASVLKYAVYNSVTGVWEILPTVVQDDGTGDYMPDLCDAEDDVILSWVSTAPEKLPLSGDDPTNEMDMMDIFTLRVPKSDLNTESGSISASNIYQITNDTVYDSLPRAVYDSESKDVLVMYTKTMPDTDYTPGSVTQKVVDYTVGGEKVYSVNAYMLYDASKGDWAWDYLYEKESSFTDPEAEANFLKEWGGQRFVRISIDGQSDPTISDMAVSVGYNGLAVYAYTVDKDYDLSTTNDKELYVQFYDFRNHATYVPIRLTNDDVSQAMPVLTRTDGDTYLFWLENGDTLKYLNVSFMLRSYTYGPNEEKIYAVRDDGSLAEGYTIPVGTVDTRTLTNDEGMEGVTGYTVLTNERTLANGESYNDLYVIWTSGETYEAEVPESRTGETRTETCKEIFASAFIHEDDRELAGDGLVEASWSKPYRLTEDRKYHDGVAAAIDSSGDLILVHNEFDMIWHGYDEDWLATHMQAGIDQNGQTYYEGDCYEYTPTNLVMTRCIPVGSLEISQLLVSDETPMPGDTVKVTAVVENAGLTTARGCDVHIYETRNGVRGRELTSLVSSDKIVVNTARKINFTWTMPGNLEGIGLECVVRERNPQTGGFFDPVTTAHSPFELAAELSSEILSITQKGDVFEAEISVVNAGNLPAEAGTVARLYLECLYGSPKDIYGVDDTILAEVDLSGLAAGAEKHETLTLNIPASVFDYCGYDAVVLRVSSPESAELDESDQFFVCLDEPMQLQLCDGSDKEMTAGQIADLDVSYALSPFRDENTSVVYTSEDTSVAAIIDGKLVGVSAGTTTVTATLLPFGTSTSVQVKVTEAKTEPQKPDPVPYPPVYPAPGTPAEPKDTVIVTESQVDGAVAAQTDGAVTIDLSGENKRITTAVIPAPEVRKLASTVDAEQHVEVALPAGTVKLDSRTLQTLAETGKDIAVTVKDNGNGTLTVKMKAGDQSISPVVKVAFPAARSGQVLVIVHPSGAEEIVKKSLVINGMVYAEIPAGVMVKVADNRKAFADVAADAWYKDAVDFVSSHELFQGTDKGFEPNAPMTRAMLATVLFRLEDGTPAGENPFADVPDGAWYADAVIWAAETGIVKGTDKGFEPNVNVTREQFATMLYRYVQYLGLDVSASASLDSFPDGGEVSGWAREAMQWAVGVGLFRGDDTGALNPKKNATRAEVATLMERVVKLIVM